MVLGGHLRDQLAGGRRTRKRDVIDARMAGERGARFMAVAGDDVERAGRQPGLGGQFGDAQHGQARVLGRLDHARVAGRERRADAAPEDLHRVVPRHDVARDAVRFAHRQHRVAGLVGEGFAVQLVGRARVELEVACERGCIGARLLQRLAGVARLDRGEFLDRIGHARRQPHQHAAALGGARGAPWARERVAGRGDRALDVGRGAARDRRERLAVGRIDDRDGFQLRGRRPFARDEMLRFFHVSSCRPELALQRLLGSHASRSTQVGASALARVPYLVIDVQRSRPDARTSGTIIAPIVIRTPPVDWL